MTEKDITMLAFSLADSIVKDPRVLALKKAEKAMEENDEVGRLAFAFDTAQTHYNDFLKIYSETSPEVQKAQKDLYLQSLRKSQRKFSKNLEKFRSRFLSAEL